MDTTLLQGPSSSCRMAGRRVLQNLRLRQGQGAGGNGEVYGARRGWMHVQLSKADGGVRRGVQHGGSRLTGLPRAPRP